MLRKAVAPFADLGVAGAITSKSRRTGGTDHTSFNAAGLPGIGTQLDPMEYQSHTWHTNLDTYERIVEDDVKAQAAVIAGVVYELAMRDEKLPRFTKEEMPKVEPPAAPAPGADAGARHRRPGHGRVTVIRSQPSHRYPSGFHSPCSGCVRPRSSVARASTVTAPDTPAGTSRSRSQRRHAPRPPYAGQLRVVPALALVERQLDAGDLGLARPRDAAGAHDAIPEHARHRLATR